LPRTDVSTDAMLNSMDSLTSERLGAMQLFFVAAEGSVEQAEALLAARVDPNSRDYEKRCPLHIAAGFGNLLMMKTLIDHGAEVNVVDYWGQTPLFECERGNHTKGETLLKDKGAKLQMLRMQKQSVREKWDLKRSDVHIGEELSRTLKSTVHRASWNGLDVVVKASLCGASGMTPEEEEEELLHEISVLGSIRHPDLVMFLGCCLQESPFMFITEYMPGGDLEKHYQRKRAENRVSAWAPPHKVVNRWARSILRALNFLHHCSTPIIHRDLKPMNILLTADLQAKVTDFGICRTVPCPVGSPHKSADQSRFGNDQHVPLARASAESNMTRGVGTWRYMAPEVARGRRYSEKIDIYAWALILYFMSSGRQPFHEYADLATVLDEFSGGLEPRPRASECPAKFRRIMESGWHVDPGKRPSAADLTEGLVEIHSKASGCGAWLFAR